MPALILYLLKVNVALILFYLAYRFALRRLTFYTLNRFFIVCGIVFSSLYPFVNLSDLLKKHEQLNSRFIVVVPDWNHVQHTVATTIAVPEFNYWQLLIFLFWTGVMIMTIRLIVRLASLYRIHKGSSPDVFNNYLYRRINGQVNPFSFWQNVYLNPLQHKEEDLVSILEHEQVHISEWHTLDILLAEINIVFYWFNPGVWLMKQAVKENLEFITDRRVLQNGIDSKAYQYSLLNISCLPNSHSLVNNFNLPDIKKRIMMMNKERSSNKQISRYLLLMPMVVILSLVFTVSKAQLEKNNFKSFSKSVFAHKAVSVITEDIPQLVSTTSGNVYQKTIGMISLKGRDSLKENYSVYKSVLSLFSDTLKAKSARQPLFIVDGVVTDFSAIDPATIATYNVVSDKTIIADYTTKYSTKIFDGIVLITLKKADKTRGLTYNTSTLPEGFHYLTANEIASVQNNSPGKDESPVSVQEARDNNIATALHGKIAGTDVAQITPGPGSSSKISISTSDGATLNFRGIDNQPLYVVDGVSFNGDAVSTISADDIATISVLKGAAATALYGTAAANGVILVTTEHGKLAPLNINTELSPNGDGVNDKFVILGAVGAGPVSLKIFTKWGELVFKQDNYKSDWTGKDTNGHDLPAGTYLYDMVTPANKIVGSILLKR